MVYTRFSLLYNSGRALSCLSRQTDIATVHIAEAIQYHSPNRKLWNA